MVVIAINRCSYDKEKWKRDPVYRNFLQIVTTIHLIGIASHILQEIGFLKKRKLSERKKRKSDKHE